MSSTGQTSLSVRDRYTISLYCHGCVGILQEWLNTPEDMTPEDLAGLFYEAMPEYLRNTWIVEEN